MATEVKLLKAYVWPVATYRYESWTLIKANETKTNDFKMKCLKCVQWISWTKKEQMNGCFLQSAGTEMHMLKSVKKGK